jgi:hypothetical protein
VTHSLGLSPELDRSFKKILENAIGYFDEKLGLTVDEQKAYLSQ